VKKAAPIILEPIMKVELTTPDEYQGISSATSPAARDHHRHRCEGGLTILNAHVPLAEMSDTPRHPVALEGARVLFDGAVQLRTGAGPG